ncbi:hypothetical protein IB276_33350 [Ensifer sp. ENS04]|uniref:hypothetical protein n=1 Tax=Ensifer sp. ENS04 TaxID=2769281 RepID=UPI0017805D03|nr:hypothetical protein [Ensifer sp. ENS04]MBD9544335.1 hypothetical protein [Ensifer sp. ENS04]
MTDSIQAAIQQAQNAAANLAASQAVSTQVAGTAVGAPVASGAPLGLDDMLSGGVAVDHWLKVTPYGLTVGDKTKPIDKLEVYLDMAEIAYSFQVKYTLNGKATYHRTYDRQTDSQGGLWIETMRKAQQIDPKAYEYRSAEIPVTATADIAHKDGSSVAATAGERLGLTLSTTGWKQFQTFVRELARKNVDPKSAILKLTLGFQTMSKPGVQDWGVPTFLSYEEVEAVPLFDTVH